MMREVLIVGGQYNGVRALVQPDDGHVLIAPGLLYPIYALRDSKEQVHFIAAAEGADPIELLFKGYGR